MATYFDQQYQTYDNTVPQVRVISNIIQLIDPTDTPLIDALGGLDAARGKFQVRQNGKKIEILEDEYLPLESTLNHGTTVATDDTQFTVSDASILQDGSVVQVDNEYMVIKAVNLTNNQVTVYARDYGGTNATHASQAAYSIVGMARIEGDDADFIGLVDITAPFNYTSIYQAALNVSGTEQVIEHYGFDNSFSYQAQKQLPQQFRLIERACFHGIRAAGADGSPRSMGGLPTYITDNVITAGSAISKGKIDDVTEAIYADGGNPDILVVNHAVARDMKDIMDTSAFIQVGLEVQQIGTAPMARVSTQYGTLRVVMTRFCPVGIAYILDSSKVGLYTLRPFGWKPLAVTGDSRKGELVGEFSLLVANDKAHGAITGITS